MDSFKRAPKQKIIKDSTETLNFVTASIVTGSVSTSITNCISYLLRNHYLEMFTTFVSMHQTKWIQKDARYILFVN